MRRRLLRGCGIAALIGITIMIIATPIASLAMISTLFFSGLVRITNIRFPFPAAYCWWIYAWKHGLDPRFTLKLVLTGGIPLALLSLPAMVLFARRRPPRRLRPARPGDTATDPERAPSSLHGNADWLSMDEAQSVFSGPDPDWGGIPVGEAYRPDQDRNRRPFDEADPLTWGQGGSAPLLLTPLTSGATSGIIIAGSGTFKTMAFTVPAMCTWRGSVVVLDPSRQVGPMVKRVRESMGQTVAIIDPANPALGSFNPLVCIDPDDPLAGERLTEFASWCSSGQEDKSRPGGDDNSKTFAEWGRELQVCLLADMMADSSLPIQHRNLREWRSRLVTPELEMPKYLKGIYANSESSFARDLAGTLMRVTPKTFSGLYRHATGDTKFLAMPAYADLLSSNSFDPRMLTRGDLTVIVQLSDDAMKASPAVGRIVIGSLARIILRAGGRMATPVPFILDEMDNLKYMRIIEVLRDQGRKSGAPLFPMWQSIGQIEDTWGKGGKKAWYASAGWRMYAMVNDEETAIEVSRRCGTYTVLSRSEGVSTSRQNPFSGGALSRGTSDNVSEQPRALISDYEVQTDLRPDEAIVIPRGRKALRCGRPLYWRRPEMVDAIDRNSPLSKPMGHSVDRATGIAAE